MNKSNFKILKTEDAHPSYKTTARQGKELHYSVGAVLERSGKYLLLDRKKPPLGFAAPAGHIDEGEEPKEALVREVREESGLEITSYKLLFKELVPWNWCGKNKSSQHYWYVYKCKASGDPNIASPEEMKSIDWYAPEEMQSLELEEVWAYWFEKLGVIEV